MKFFKTVRPLGSFGSGITSQVITKVKSKTNHLGIQGNTKRINGIYIYQTALTAGGNISFTNGTAAFTSVFSIPQMTASAFMHVWELKFFLSGYPKDVVGDVSIQATIESAGVAQDYAAFTLKDIPNVANQMATCNCFLVVVPSKTSSSTVVTITATATQPISPGSLNIALGHAKLTGINVNHFTSTPGAVITPYASISEVPFENRIFLLPADSPIINIDPGDDSAQYAVDPFFTEPGPSNQHVVRTGLAYKYDKIYALSQPNHFIYDAPSARYSAFPYHNYGHASLVDSEIYGVQLPGGILLNKAAWANRIRLWNSDAADRYSIIKKKNNIPYSAVAPKGIATTFGFGSLANTVVNGLNCLFLNHGDLEPDVWELGKIDITPPGSFDEVPKMASFGYGQYQSIVQISVEIGDLITPVKSTTCLMAVQPYFDYTSSTMKSAFPGDGANYDATNNILTAIEPYSYYGAESTKYPLPCINQDIIDPSSSDHAQKSLLVMYPYCSFTIGTQAFTSSRIGAWTNDTPPNTGYSSLLNFEPSPHQGANNKIVSFSGTSAIQVFYEDNQELIREGAFQIGKAGIAYARTLTQNPQAQIALGILEGIGGAIFGQGQQQEGQDIERRDIFVNGWDNYGHMFASIAEVYDLAENVRDQPPYTPNPDVAFPS